MAATDGPAPRTDTHDPRVSRSRALMLLFQADLRGLEPIELLERVIADPTDWAILDAADDTVILGRHPVDPAGEETTVRGRRLRTAAPLDGFTRTLVAGVSAERATLDERIGRHAREWRVERMPALDRAVLRLATWELLHETTPVAVVIDEAVEAVKTLSTPDSGRFINGVLAAIAREIATSAQATGSPSGQGGEAS
jgi:transcription antitermination protein NusB